MQTVVRKGPLWIVLWLLATCQTHGIANQKPNIFFIAVDDMGREYGIRLILSTCLRITMQKSYKLSTTFIFVKEIMTLVTTIPRWKLRILTTWRTMGLFWNPTTCILSVVREWIISTSHNFIVDRCTQLFVHNISSLIEKK